MGAYAREVLDEADALLLGRITFEVFAQAWPSVVDATGFADRMNSMPKFVASTTSSEPLAWNATLVQGDVLNAVHELKGDHTLLINGSGELVQTLMRAGVIDDFWIWAHPVAIGAGKRLFTEGTSLRDINLKGTRTTGKGIVILELQAAR